MMSNFELWVKACEEFDYKIYKLTDNKEDGHGVYMTIKEYYPPGSYNTMRQVCYHLWWHDNHEIARSDAYTELYQIFCHRLEEEYYVRENQMSLLYQKY